MKKCAICGEPVNPTAYGTYRYMEGWAKRRKAGGPNALADPRRWNRWAHKKCVERK